MSISQPTFPEPFLAWVQLQNIELTSSCRTSSIFPALPAMQISSTQLGQKSSIIASVVVDEKPIGSSCQQELGVSVSQRKRKKRTTVDLRADRHHRSCTRIASGEMHTDTSNMRSLRARDSQCKGLVESTVRQQDSIDCFDWFQAA